MPGKIVLRTVAGPFEGKHFEFTEHDTFMFGRASDCQMVLPSQDPTASRYHFLLEVNPPYARIRDLGSLNGTYVNGLWKGGREPGESPEEGRQRDFPEVELQAGDCIEVGQTKLECHIEKPSIRSGDLPFRVHRAATSRGAKSADKAIALLEMLVEEARQKGEPIPDDIGGHELIRLLGEGGMGAVYLARRKRDGKEVALKIMLSQIEVDKNLQSRFLREIDVTNELRHPHIVPFIERAAVGSGFWFTMEYCRGGSLSSLLERRGGKLPIDDALRIVFQVLDGLACAHEHGFVHRDLKPDNILLTDTEGSTAKMNDFGLAKNFQLAGLSGYTRTGDMFGTPDFMPREQIINFKYVKPVTDVWAMGATLYNMLTGQLPRDIKEGQDPIFAVLTNRIVPVRERDAGIPSKLAEVIDRSLDNDETTRPYQDATQLLDALRGAV